MHSSASSAEELATFPANTLVFVPDAKDCFAAALVTVAFRQGDEGGQVELLKEEGDDDQAPTQTLTLSSAQSLQCQAMDDQSLWHLENMVEFRVLNEASLLHNLRVRFAQDLIYTSIGDILVSLNPFKMMEDLYTPDAVDTYIKLGSSANAPPHVFRIADRAVRRMLEDRKPQSCIVSGESGAGKTEATKVFLQFIAEVSLRNASKASAAVVSESNLQDRILQANPLLEAFGNAKTKRNDNSSRFGKYIQVNFNPAMGTVVGGQMTSYLLEKSRVVFVTEGERNYHIFYQLVAGAALDKQLRTKYMISNAPTDYYYLNQSTCVSIEEINDGRGWQQTIRAMEMIGITEQQRKEVFVTLAGVLHLGNVSFNPATQQMAQVTEKTSLDSLSFAAQCLGFPTDNLALAITKRDVSVRGEKIFKDLTVLQAQMQRDALSKQVYSLLFDWLLVSVNKSLEAGNCANEAPAAATISIGILDIFGFESFQRNSLEQLCINYCNEKLQGHFNSFVFTLEQSQYQLEGLDVSEIRFKDNSDTVRLLETKRTGMLSMLDEEGNMPNGSDVMFLKRVLDTKSPLINKPDINLIRHNPKEYTNVFILTHFAGPVCYNVEGFLEKNKDTLSPELNALLQNTDREFILDLLPEETKEKQKKTSLGFKFRAQLDQLMETLECTQPHFIRCIKPNFEKVADSFTATMVLSQLRYSGLLEVCRIRQNGYPVQRTFADFQARYGLLAAEDSNNSSADIKQLVGTLANMGVLPMSNAWQVGKTKMFLRNAVLTLLEQARDEKLRGFAIDLQRVGRGYVARCKHKRYLRLLAALREAMQSKDESKLESAILSSGSLPYRGVHLKLVQEAHTILERLRVCSRCLKQVVSAIASQDLVELNSALRVAEEISFTHEQVTEAKTLAQFIAKSNELKVKLRSAIQSRDLPQIQHFCAAAREHSAKIDTSEAEIMIERLLYIQTLGEEIASLVQSKGDVKKVMQLVNTLRESGGAADHASVLLGQAYANEQASVSAAHAKRVKEIKEKIAASMDDLLNLIMLEMEAIQLGIDKDADLKKYWERKQELEHQALLETEVTAAASLLQSKDNAQLTEQDIIAYEEILRKITWRDIAADKSLADLSRKQLVARKRLDDLLKLPTKGEADIKQAIKEAQALGINSETARKAQAMLTLKSIAAEEKKEMRRRSMMPAAGYPMPNLGLQSMIQSDPFFSSLDEDSSIATTAAMSRKARPSLRPARAPNAPLGPPPGLKLAGGNVKQAAEDSKARCLQRMRAAQANHADWTLQCMEYGNRAFKFENFSGFRSNEDFSATEVEVERKLFLATNKLMHTTQLIPKSLLELPTEELNSEALSCFKSVLGWSLDANAQFPQTLAVHFLKQGMQNEDLCDELYAQLLKQLRRNPGKESVDRLWLLLCLTCEYFAPSREFLPCVVNFLILQEPETGDLIVNYSKWCLFQLNATIALGKSVVLPPPSPTVKLVSSFMARPPVILKIHLVYRTVVEVMNTIEVPVWPDQDVGFVEKIVCEMEHFDAETCKVSGLFLKDMEKPRPMAVAPPPASVEQSPTKLRVDTKAVIASAAAAVVPSPLAIKSKILNFVRTKKTTNGNSNGAMEDDSVAAAADRRVSMGSESGASIFASGRISSVSTRSDGASSFLRNAKSKIMLNKGKSFRITKSAGGTSFSAGDEFELGSGGEDSFAYVAVGGGNAGFVESSANGEDEDAGNKKTTGGTAVVAQQVSRVPPPPFAPWPLPRSFFPGDVFLRLVSQDRLPYLTYQRKLFVFDTQPNQATYIQILQDVLNNRLPLADFWQVLQLACISAIRAHMVRGTEPAIFDVQSLVSAGFYSYIPLTWLNTTQYDWANIAMTYLQDQGSVLLEMSEIELYNQYLTVCQSQPLFGASLFSVIHKNMVENLVACLNAPGLHVLTNEAAPVVLGVVSYAEMKRFGASSTSVWIEVSNDTAQRLPQLVGWEEDKHVLHLHTQQAREIYQLLADYSYWFHHGFVKDSYLSGSL